MGFHSSAGGLAPLNQRSLNRSISSLREAYSRGDNIMALLAESDANPNSFEAIQVAYDLQAGSYTKSVLTPDGGRLKAEFAAALRPHVEGYSSMLDAGVGEATTLTPLLELLPPFARVLGYDSSVSRLLWARANITRAGRPVRLFVADTTEIPLPDSSVEVVVSVHSIEPNGGRETELLTELLRVASRRVVLVEPTTRFASAPQLLRMRKMGYCMDLPEKLELLGANIVLHEPWAVNSNPENSAELIVIDVNQASVGPQEPDRGEEPAFETPFGLVAPGSLAELEIADGGLYSRRDGLYFPVVAGLPVLTRRNAVVATQLLERIGSG